MHQTYEICHACQLRGDRVLKLVASKEEVNQYSRTFTRYYCDTHTKSPIQQSGSAVKNVRQTVEDLAIARINEVGKTLNQDCFYGQQAIARLADIEWSFVTAHKSVKEALKDLSDDTKERQKRFLKQQKEANPQVVENSQILINESLRRLDQIASKIGPDRAWKGHEVAKIAGVSWNFALLNEPVKNAIAKLVFEANQQFYIGQAERAIAQLKERGEAAPMKRIIKQIGVSEGLLRDYPKVLELVKNYSIESGGYGDRTAKRLLTHCA